MCSLLLSSCGLLRITDTFPQSLQQRLWWPRHRLPPTSHGSALLAWQIQLQSPVAGPSSINKSSAPFRNLDCLHCDCCAYSRCQVGWNPSSVWDLSLPQIPYRRLNLPDEVICNKLPPRHTCRALVSPACFPVCRRLCAYPWGGWPLTHPISSFLRSLIPNMHAAPFSYCHWLLFLLFPLCCHLPSLFLSESSPKAGKDACLASSGGLVFPWGYKIELMSSLRQGLLL